MRTQVFCLVLVFFLHSHFASGQWVQTSGPYGGEIACLAVSGMNLFAGASGGGVYFSTDSGTSWKAVNNGLLNPYGLPWGVSSLAVSGTILVAGTAGGVFRSTNNGTSWTPFNTGLPNTYVWSLAIIDTNVFAGTNGVGVWRRPLSGMIGSIGESISKIPALFRLEQNYPNPFNPSTTIRYGLPNRSQVTLAVFNTLGQQVAVLQNGEQEAGYHEVKFDGAGLSSGVYFYRIEVRPLDSAIGRDSKSGAGAPSLRSGQGSVQTRKLLLLR